jgi:hypothetical protein
MFVSDKHWRLSVKIENERSQNFVALKSEGNLIGRAFFLIYWVGINNTSYDHLTISFKILVMTKVQNTPYHKTDFKKLISCKNFVRSS